jgi:2,3-bisphosphoglycerate-independent phosphoglycerate mutase
MTGRPRGAGNRRFTGNPVPFHLIDDLSTTTAMREDGTLEDVAPTILAILGIDKPVEMTGRDLRL